MTASTVLTIVLGVMVLSAWGLLNRDSIRDRDRGL